MPLRTRLTEAERDQIRRLKTKPLPGIVEEWSSQAMIGSDDDDFALEYDRKCAPGRTAVIALLTPEETLERFKHADIIIGRDEAKPLDQIIQIGHRPESKGHMFQVFGDVMMPASYVEESMQTIPIPSKESLWGEELILTVSILQETIELEVLLSAVHTAKGHDDYNATPIN